MAAVTRPSAASSTTWPLLIAVSVASAQPTTAPADPVVAHFREYRAALARDDLPAAEAAAAAALAASEAARGQRTAVLALNLAALRLELGLPYDALTPARTAHALATGADSGIDPRAAALTLGRAEIAAGDAAGSARLLEAFTASESDAALENDVYNGAVELGTWSLEAKEYDVARRAWASAARLARTAHDPAFACARALTAEGAAIFLADNDRTALPPAGQNRALTAADAKAASDAFVVAQRLLLPAAFAENPSARPTAGQFAYAEAMAWQSALLAKIEIDGEELPAAPVLGNDIPPFDNNGACKMNVRRDGAEISYPPEALSRYGVGAVVLHMGLDASGAVTGRTIAAAIPPGVLADAVEAVANEWRVERDPSSPAGCRVPSSAYVNIRFVLE